MKFVENRCNTLIPFGAGDQSGSCILELLQTLYLLRGKTGKETVASVDARRYVRMNQSFGGLLIEITTDLA